MPRQHLFVAFVLFPCLAGAQEPARTLTLRDTLTTAIVQNRTIRSASIDLEISNANVLSGYGADDFQLQSNASYRRARNQVIPTRIFNTPEQDIFHVDATLTKPLWFGGRIGLTLSNDFTREVDVLQDQLGNPFQSSSQTHSPAATLVLFMPLLRGLGEKAARVDRLRAEAARDVTGLDAVDKASAVVRDVVQAYWELAYTIDQLEIRKSSLELARQQLQVTQARLDVGVGAPTDLAAVRQTIATREEDILLAEQALAEQSLAVRQLAGMDIKPNEILLRTGEKLLANPVTIELAGALDKSLAATPQIATARARGNQQQVEVNVTENGLLPQLDLSANFGPNAAADSFGQSVDDLVGFKNTTIFVQLTLNTSLGNRGPRGQYEAALANMRKVRLTEEDIRAQVSVAVARAVDVVQSTQKRLEVDAVGTQLALVNLDAEKARFEVGRTTNFEVVRRQDELAQSRLRQARAAADYLKAVAVLEQLTGEILGRYAINLKKPPAR